MSPIKHPSQELFRALDEQRARIGRNLHDLAAQQIAVIKIQLDAVRRRSRSGSKREQLDRVIEDVDRLAESLHDAVTELRPALLKVHGLAVSIQQLAENWSSRVGTPVSVDLYGEAEAIEPDTASALYYVVQEALTNIARHASGASQVSIMLQQIEGRIVLSIENDGIGFVSQTQSELTGRWGLIGLHERLALVGGVLEITSKKASGTTITAYIS